MKFIYILLFIVKKAPLDSLPYLTGENNLENINNYHKECVEQIQGILGIKVDGIAGPETFIRK